jgi:hypothetical protein
MCTYGWNQKDGFQRNQLLARRGKNHICETFLLFYEDQDDDFQQTALRVVSHRR